LTWKAHARYAQHETQFSNNTIAALTQFLQGEHGIGLGKKDSLKKELGLETIDVMRSVKRSLDPHWLLNPGKIFDLDIES
jgi:FAD/FMN-containing dehydrogenase